MRVAAIVVAAMLATACGGRSKPVRPQPATVALGDCADPERDGIIGSSPRLDHADRDLDGDGRKEIVVADRSLCSGEGNCHWNVFAQSGRCWRYLGTVSAAGLEVVAEPGSRGFPAVVGWWRFRGGRSLRQEYQFRHGAYRLVETLICREQADDRVLCASDEDPGAE